mmetsp:Transcript_25178/g.54533  ORF Transcript_25178/g.54533 Transcript_25178/m.54533 type:complete len:209 (-) Transcript_25178:644-1270(-)
MPLRHRRSTQWIRSIGSLPSICPWRASTRRHASVSSGTTRATTTSSRGRCPRLLTATDAPSVPAMPIRRASSCSCGRRPISSVRSSTSASSERWWTNCSASSPSRRVCRCYSRPPRPIPPSPGRCISGFCRTVGSRIGSSVRSSSAIPFTSTLCSMPPRTPCVLRRFCRTTPRRGLGQGTVSPSCESYAKRRVTTRKRWRLTLHSSRR